MRKATSTAADRSVRSTLASTAADRSVRSTLGLFLGGDAVGDFVVLGFGQDTAGYEVAGGVVGASGNDSVGFGSGHARQGLELVFGGGVQVERLVAAPAFTDSLGDGPGVTLGFGGGARGLLSQFVGAFRLSRAAG